MSVPSHEMLVGACASMGLARDGTREDLHRRLGDALVAQLFAPWATVVATEVPQANVGSKRKARIEGPPKHTATAWQAFLKVEKDRVKQAGFKGRVDIIKEVARRWKLHKRVNTCDAPLMLTQSDSCSEAGSSSTDAIEELIREDIPADKIKDALNMYGLPVHAEYDVNVATLARAMS